MSKDEILSALLAYISCIVGIVILVAVPIVLLGVRVTGEWSAILLLVSLCGVIAIATTAIAIGHKATGMAMDERYRDSKRQAEATGYVVIVWGAIPCGLVIYMNWLPTDSALLTLILLSVATESMLSFINYKR